MSQLLNLMCNIKKLKEKIKKKYNPLNIDPYLCHRH